MTLRKDELLVSGSVHRVRVKFITAFIKAEASYDFTVFTLHKVIDMFRAYGRRRSYKALLICMYSSTAESFK